MYFDKYEHRSLPFMLYSVELSNFLSNFVFVFVSEIPGVELVWLVVDFSESGAQIMQRIQS